MKEYITQLKQLDTFLVNIQPGDSLVKIAYNYLRRTDAFRDVAIINNLSPVEKLITNRNIQLPNRQQYEELRERFRNTLEEAVKSKLPDLSSVKMPNTAQQLISWVI